MHFLSWAALVTTASAASFSYDRCNSTTGPTSSAWGGDCQTANLGTPVNLCGAVAFSGSAPSLVLSSSYSSSRSVRARNNGHTIQIDMISNQPTLQAGSLSQIVGYTSNTTTQTWALEQVHFHWGRTGKTDEGSEHYLQGARYPLEAHYVHYNTRLGNSVTAAASSGAKDALLVVGVFLDIGSDVGTLMSNIASNATGYTTTPSPQSYTVTLTDLFDGTGTYYSYAGGLTTPNCNFIVTWVVMQATKTISLATLNKFKAASENPPGTASPLISDDGNFRPLQGKGSRTFYNSAGATAACTTVTEPTFTCTTTSAAGSVRPALFHSLALVLFMLFACR